MKACISIVELRPQLLAILLVGVAACQANADLNQIATRSIEWLVDNNDTIAVYRMHDHAASEAPTLLKGDPRDISHPLNPPNYDDYRYFKAHGPIRLLFVRNGRELLHDIDLDRGQILRDFPSLTRVVYGVTRFGELLLSEASLFRVITDRINSGPGTPLPPDSSWAHARISGIVAPHDFPL